jgi:hypothetical protein
MAWWGCAVQDACSCRSCVDQERRLAAHHAGVVQLHACLVLVCPLQLPASRSCVNCTRRRYCPAAQPQLLLLPTASTAVHVQAAGRPT